MFSNILTVECANYGCSQTCEKQSHDGAIECKCWEGYQMIDGKCEGYWNSTCKSTCFKK